MDVISNLIEAHIFRITTEHRIEFLLMKRNEQERYPNIWQMVTGSIENEKAFVAALREIKEETGITPQKLWIVPKVNSFYSHEQDCICMIPVFAAKISEYDEVKISDEHSEFKWVEKDEAKKLLAWQGQRDSVDIICEYFLQESSILQFIEIPV